MGDKKKTKGQRLQKVLAAAGVGSRRHCEELIREGIVRVNRKVVDELPVFVNPEKDVITVNGKRIHEARKVYFLLYKPKKVICTNSDPQGRRRAIDLIDCRERIFCVGRLDADTTGAIMLTNDSELANRLTHPRYELDKTYEVRVKGRMDGEAIEKLKKGVWLAEGRTGKARLKVLRRSNSESVIEVIIRQGLNRQIRRSMAKVGYRVKGLRRTKIGRLGLRELRAGQYRELSQAEVTYLRKETAKRRTDSKGQIGRRGKK